jgi:hypothetical protein
VRRKTSAAEIVKLMQFLGRAARGPGCVYFTGGATAVMLGWRDATVDIDLKLDPEPPGVFESLREAKEDIGINIELAAPDDFIPALPGWKERSRFIATHGAIEFRHYDFFAQALAKIERGHTQDVADVQSMFRQGLVSAPQLRALFESIRPHFDRYPAIDVDSLSEKLDETLERLGGPDNG